MIIYYHFTGVLTFSGPNTIMEPHFGQAGEPLLEKVAIERERFHDSQPPHEDETRAINEAKTPYGSH